MFRNLINIHVKTIQFSIDLKTLESIYTGSKLNRYCLFIVTFLNVFL